MSTTERRVYTLTGDTHRQFVASLVLKLADQWRVIVEPPRRSLDQNALLHRLCGQIAKARPEYCGIQMDAEDYKALFIVSFGEEEREAEGKKQTRVRLVRNLCGTGLVQLRESSARMDKSRASKLLTYIDQWAAKEGITLTEDGR